RARQRSRAPPLERKEALRGGRREHRHARAGGRRRRGPLGAGERYRWAPGRPALHGHRRPRLERAGGGGRLPARGRWCRAGVLRLAERSRRRRGERGAGRALQTSEQVLRL
ncbi:MAG: hypothetical protein AVDCRST_MAG17-1617, partial [uncultured Solirubrobacterales bacterium]